jgi:aryl-alcohol dehydrogenase-like predicted oxidoreductase
MEVRRLGNSDLRITLIGFGAWAIGGMWKYGWGPQSEKDSIATIHLALDRGINWIDTAAVYGLGTSEVAVGKAIAERKEKPYVFTKCSMVWDDEGTVSNSLRADSVKREAEASLSRLGVDAIDLYQIHWPRHEEALEEGWQALVDLRDEGKVRHIGVSNFNVEQLKRIEKIAPVTSLQPPYSLIARDVEDEILPYCRDRGIGVIVYSPMGSGLLTGAMTKKRVKNLHHTDWRKGNPNFQEPRLSRHLELVELLKDIGKGYGRTAGEIAVAWTLKNPAVTAAIVGMRRPDQVEGVIHAADVKLSDDDMKRIDSFITENP